MKNKVISLWMIIKKNYAADKIGFLSLSLAYFFITLSIISIPLFTYRDNLTFITNTLCIGASAAIVLYLFFRGKFYINFYLLFTGLFLIYAVIITLFTTRTVGFEKILSLFTLYGYVFCLIEFWFNRKSEKFFITTFCFGIFLFSCLFIYTYRENIIAMNFNERFGYDFGNVNTICSIFAFGIMFMLYIVLKNKRWAFLLLIPIAIMAFCALITGSRWGLVSLIIGVLILVYQMVGKRYKIEFFAGFALLIAVLVGILQIPAFEEYRKHFIILFDFFAGKSKQLGSTAVRTSMFLDGLKLWFKNIFFGYGANGFFANTSYGMYSHSSIIELLTNFGLIGFILFYLPIIKVLLNAKHQKRTDIFLLSKSILLFFLVYSFFAMSHSSKVVILCLSIFVGTDFFYNKEKEMHFEFSFFADRKFKFNHQFCIPNKNNVVTNEVTVPSKLKIAFVISSLYDGGAERVATRLASNWVENGHDVEFFLTSVGGDKMYPFDSRIVVNNIARKTKLRLLPSFKINMLEKEISNYKPDVIVSFLTTPSFYASVVAKRLNIPFISSERNDPSKSSLLYKALKRMTYLRSNHVVFQGQYPMDYYPKIIKEKSSILYNPVCVEKVKNYKKEKALISVGRLDKQKGFDVLIKAFSNIYNKHPDFVLKIFGEGSEYNKLTSLINELHLNDKVFLLPFSNSIHDEMKKCSVFVLSYRFEGMPNAMCEAMLLGLPVVSSDCPIGLSKDLVDDNVNGVICKTDDVNSLSDGLDSLISDLEKYSEAAKNKVTEYQKVFDVDTISSSWINIFNNAIKNKTQE